MHNISFIDILFASLWIVYGVHIVLFWVGCKQHTILPSHEKLKAILVWNRVLFFVLLFVWLQLQYGQLFYLSNKALITIGVLVLSIGQVLNMAVYRAIGSDGVYYGSEYGVTSDKKLSGFPFNIPHPMYTGCLLTTIGMFFIFGFDENNKVRTRALAISSYIFLLYLVSIIIERNGCSPA